MYLGYQELPFAAIRTVIINRFPKQGKRVKAVRAVMDSFEQLLAKFYQNSPELFARPHLPPGERIASKPSTKEARDIITRYYMQDVTELGGTVQICQHLGLGVTLMGVGNKKMFNMDTAPYFIEDADDNQAWTANLGEDSIRYGLQIQVSNHPRSPFSPRQQSC